MYLYNIGAWVKRNQIHGNLTLQFLIKSFRFWLSLSLITLGKKSYSITTSKVQVPQAFPFTASCKSKEIENNSYSSDQTGVYAKFSAKHKRINAKEFPKPNPLTFQALQTSQSISIQIQFNLNESNVTQKPLQQQAVLYTTNINTYDMYAHIYMMQVYVYSYICYR